jgi:hypothetical protein
VEDTGTGTVCRGLRSRDIDELQGQEYHQDKIDEIAKQGKQFDQPMIIMTHRQTCQGNNKGNDPDKRQQKRSVHKGMFLLSAAKEKQGG